MRWKNKYKAKRATVGAIGFHSKAEAGLYVRLSGLQNLGIIKELQTQQQVTLTDAKIIYKPDFTFVHVKTGALIHGEFKGLETPEWRIKKKLYVNYGPAPLIIWKMKGKKLFVDEIIMRERYDIAAFEDLF